MEANKLLKSFGRHLRCLRLEAGMSQEQLALHCELDRTYISGVERGLRNISLINMYKLAQTLNLSLDILTKFDMEEINDRE